MTRLISTDRDMKGTTFGRDAIDVPTSVAVDRSGNAVVTGYSTNSATRRGDSFVAYYQSDGTQRYFKPFGSPGASTALPPSVAAAFAADGSVYVAGSFEDRISFGGGELVSQGRTASSVRSRSRRTASWSR